MAGTHATKRTTRIGGTQARAVAIGQSLTSCSSGPHAFADQVVVTDRICAASAAWLGLAETDRRGAARSGRTSAPGTGSACGSPCLGQSWPSAASRHSGVESTADSARALAGDRGRW